MNRDDLTRSEVWANDRGQYKSERREKRRRNNRKMGVAGRSVLLLAGLAARRVRRKEVRRG